MKKLVCSKSISTVYFLENIWQGTQALKLVFKTAHFLQYPFEAALIYPSSQPTWQLNCPT